MGQALPSRVYFSLFFFLSFFGTLIYCLAAYGKKEIRDTSL